MTHRKLNKKHLARVGLYTGTTLGSIAAIIYIPWVYGGLFICLFHWHGFWWLTQWFLGLIFMMLSTVAIYFLIRTGYVIYQGIVTLVNYIFPEDE